MITAIYVSVCILGLFLMLIVLLSISVDFRAIIDVDKNDFVLEGSIFKRLRLLRLRVTSANGTFYLKALKKPYRSLGYLAEKVKKEKTRESAEIGKKLDLTAVYKALTKRKLHLEHMRVYVNVGGEDSLATSMIWGGAETIAGIALALASSVIVSDDVSVLIRPEFKYASLQADAYVRARLGSILFTAVTVALGLKRGAQAEAA